MELTDALRSWAVEHLEVAADAEDDEFRKAIKAAQEDGRLDGETFARLVNATSDAKDELAELIQASVASALESQNEAQKMLAQSMQALAESMKPQEKAAEPKEPDQAAAIKAAVDEQMKAWKPQQEPTDEPEDDGNAQKLYAGMAGEKPAGQPRVKKAIERYSSTKSRLIYPERTGKGGRHPLAGQPVCGVSDEPVDSLSEQELAVCGAFLKATVPKNRYQLTEHEEELLKYAVNEMPWNGDCACGPVEKSRGPDGTQYKGHPDMARFGPTSRTKAQYHVINGTTSGGQYAVPTPLDALIIMEPLLYGELFPRVTLRPATANSVNGFTVGNITVAAVTEGTALTCFDCTGLLSNLDTTMYAVGCGVRLGLDWLSDTPVNFANVVRQNIGERHMEWLDNQIANGDGTTEPEGIFTKSGTTSVSSQGGTSGPYQTADAENLCFGVSKARRKRNRCAYVMSDTAYSRYRQIITATNYQTRALGMDEQSYKILDYDVAIQNDINVAYSAFCDFTDYILYRRLGAQFRTSTEGETLMKANLMLITFHARWGGQLALAAACSVCTDGDSSQSIS